MSRIWSMMDTGRRSMMNSQTSLQTTAHNIANKSTEGYSRQRVEIKANEPVGEGHLRIGMGAKAGVITRTNDSYLEKQIEREGSELGFLNAKGGMLGRVESVYSDQDGGGLAGSMTAFFNSFRELSNNPESQASRTQVRETAQGMAKDFRKVNEQLGAIAKDGDFQIVTKVEQINQITKEIATLNEKISMVELQGMPANDERDRRDHLVKQLSEKINIRHGESKDGQLTITAGNTALLVSGFSHRDLVASGTPARPGHADGSIDLFYLSNDDSTPVNVTRQMTGGEIGGILAARDGAVGGLVQSMDKLASALATSVNEIHAQGYDAKGRTGNLFFKPPPENGLDASSSLQVDDAIMRDVSFISAGGQPNAPGDNRVANILSNLEYQGAMPDGSTFDSFYGTQVGQIGVEAQRGNSAVEAQKGIVSQLKNIRESISGVSLDEETTKMIEFQKAFEASARLVKTADEMLDTVLRLKQM